MTTPVILGRPKHTLKRRQVTEKNIEEFNNLYDEFKFNFSGVISYGRVESSRIWIGNMGAAIDVAEGKITKFSSVVNASGCESTGISLVEIARRNQVQTRHETVWDERGISFMDVEEHQTWKDVISQRIKYHGKSNPGYPHKFFIVNDKYYPTYGHESTINTDASVLNFLYRGAERINYCLQKYPNGHILVHCYAGRNRSAACVAMYFILYMKMKPADVIKMVRGSVSKRLFSPGLDNRRFKDLLLNPVSRNTVDFTLEKEISAINRELLTSPDDYEKLYTDTKFEDDRTYPLDELPPKIYRPTSELSSAIQKLSVNCQYDDDFARNSLDEPEICKKKVCQHCGCDCDDPLTCGWCYPPKYYYCSPICQRLYLQDVGGCECTRLKKTI